MSIIDYLPGVEVAKNYIAGIAIATVAGIVAWHVHIEHADAAQIVSLKAELKSEQEAHANDLAAEAAAEKTAQAQADAEGARRVAALGVIQDESQKAIARANADAASAATSHVSLRRAASRVAASADSCRANPAPAAVSETASSPGAMLADVLGLADYRAGALAKALDDARNAGQQCEQSYDALNLPKPASAP